ncbi:MAG TPA: formylglycine-generating enzyme family protein [Candidatus Competibacteraceae bacterium]|nr:formylglycine-generating enzyme family protein [Candidatus Competibacteraceae bacterium]
MSKPTVVKTPSLIDTAWHPLATGCPPGWASGWGQDRYGVFVEFTVREVTQRLRWIPPGRFWMGSPEEEPGHYDNEGPRHPVTLTHGYWLFDTPCTQALWTAVMGQNPSQFQSPTRPVENVSWEDVQTFLSKINEQIPNLHLALPSEAQWEYACRAGTETAIYTGDLAILGKCNAPALDPIAWYGGNSGVNFDLTNGDDSSSWKEKQYPHTRAGTRPVKLKKANPWGLYDMLGNVMEWTQDRWHENYQDAPTNGLAWEDRSTGERRPLRGGAWDGKARYVRASCRIDRSPNYRSGLIGFRCAQT